ncbi:hypothetical protein D3C85_1649400 [compost metagenome]
MAAHLVQHQHGVLVERVDEMLQPLEQDLVAALTVGTQGRILEIADILQRDPITGALAAGLVVPPDHLQPGALEHIQQTLFIPGLAGVVILAPHVGKHAGHRHRCFSAA